MAKRVAYTAILIALAMIFSYVEVLIPFHFGIPGIKLGLANLVVVIALYILKPAQVMVISIARIVLVSFLFGNMSSMLYSLAGGILSFFVMLLLKKIKGFSMLGVSIAGGVSHNVGQLLLAAVVVENMSVFYYMPVLLVAGVITGMLIGVVAKKVSVHIRLTVE
ncbi:MAG: Gx transporter family protein [Lachnospiraceae bacterium]|nr:Gx transporter family protein [Lachnospiraceae bacterium]